MTAKERNPDEEQRLIDGMLSGLESAFDEFADHYIPGVYRFALKQLSGDEELARDLSQAAVCKAIDKLSSFRRDSSLFTWLCACCKNEIRMHFRSESRRPRLVPLEAPELASSRSLQVEGSQEAAVLETEALRLTYSTVHQTLDSLPPRYAKALSWKYLEKVPVVEIAHRLDIGSKAAESLLTRARHAFRKTYEAVQIEDSLSSPGDKP
jgi:RNA polymerase sigma-70 factor (ECF subfamily)